jgi:hypothetical protein
MFGQLQATGGRKIVVGLLLVSVLAVAACSSGGGNTSNGGSSTANNAGPAATATAKPKPTMPALTADKCAQLFSVAEANAAIPTSTPATSVQLGNPYLSGSTNGGACNYKISATSFLLVIWFLPWNGPDPIPQSDIQAALSQAAGNHITVSNLTMVSGIGDQAAYVEASGNYQGQTFTQHIFYVLEGSFFFDCVTYDVLSPVQATESQLQQCASTVNSRL